MIALAIAGLIAYFAIGSAQRAKEIEDLASRCPVIYMSIVKNGRQVVTKILKSTAGAYVPYPVKIGEMAPSNRVTAPPESKSQEFEQVVFVEPNSEKNTGRFYWQAEVPVIEGRLIPYPVTLDELMVMIASEKPKG